MEQLNKDINFGKWFNKDTHADQETIQIKTPSIYYFDRFFGLKCAPDLWTAKVFPNAKELTESFAAYDAINNKLRKHPVMKNIDLGDIKVKMFAVGDGSTPRTAATFAFRSKWNCYSIDPRMRDAWVNQHKKANCSVVRLKCINKKIEDVTVGAMSDIGLRPDVSIIACVHAHVKDLYSVVQKLHGKKTTVLVAIPCCVSQNEIDGRKPDIEYKDYGIWSDKRTVKIWLFGDTGVYTEKLK